ncbi:MAG: tetratricopeptide repeat protein [Bacteroidetes bacterium]|nr:tetratricopeptide repeat protein [Bacteroidota bacterium]
MRPSHPRTTSARKITQNNPEGEPAELSTGRKRAFTFVAIALPFMLLFLLEGSLRLAGYGGIPPLFHPVEGYQGFIQPDENAGARFFPSIATPPNIPFDSFREPPVDESIRIIMQGGSTGAGWPYYFGANIADLVEAYLQQSFPGRTVEVMNTSMAAVNSYTLLDLSEEIIDLEPDAVLIYAGHNEYYGALGVGSSQGIGSNPAFVNLYLKLRRLRTTQLVQDMTATVAGWLVSSPAQEQSGTLMQNMVREQRIPLGSDLYEKGIEQFRFNMSLLLSNYEKAGIPVYIGTLASNIRDQAPFISGTGSTDESDNQVAAQDVVAALRALAEADSLRAQTMLDRVIEDYPSFAVAYYHRGLLNEQIGDTVQARSDLETAREQDELRFRAPSTINTIIRELASDHSATIVESEAAMAGAASNGLIGRELMLEHLHPTVEGYRILGTSFFLSLAENGFRSEDGLNWSDVDVRGVANTRPVITDLDSLVGAYRVQQLTGSWPFQALGSRFMGVDTLMAGTFVGDVALRTFQNDMQRVEALDALRINATRQNELDQAAEYLGALTQRYPMVPGPFLALAKIQVTQNQLMDAETTIRAELTLQESGEAQEILGTVLLSTGRVEESITHLERAIELNADDLRARYNLAGAFALKGQYDKARFHAQEVIRRNPGSEDARRLLASLPSS